MAREQGREKKICPRCGSALKFQGCRERKIHLGVHGEFTVNRAYYTCTSSKCKHSEFPLDRSLGISGSKAAGRFEEQICYLAAHMPFEWVRYYLKRFEKLDISETLIRTTAEGCGSAFIRTEERQADELIRGHKENLDMASGTPECLYVQADGAHVPIIGEKNGKKCVEYRENKLAVLFREKDIRRNAKGNCRIIKKRFASSLGQGVTHFEKLLRKTAVEMGSLKARTIVFISDGAEWIDQLRERLFPNSIHILDWYHAVEHLHECARAIFGENSKDKIVEWVAPLKQLLWEGNAPEVCQRLILEKVRRPHARTAIQELHSYYSCRLEKMNYQQFRRMGYFIGSGAVESANKYVMQQRLKQAGMKWNLEGAAALIHLRQRIYENRWDRTWGRRAA